jgi:LPS-assembly protein
VAGLGADLELRWAPAPDVYGQLALRYLHDSGHSYWGALRSPDRGDRLALTLSHGQRLSSASRLRVELGLATDPELPSDFTLDSLLRDNQYSRSSLTWTHRFGEALVEADASYLLPLKNLGYASGPSRDFPTDPVTGVPRFSYGLFGASVPVFHRLPAASAFLLPQRLAGPVFLSGSLGLARFAPVKGSTGDEGAGGAGPGERLWLGLLPAGQPLPTVGEGLTPAVDRTGQLDGRWQPGERLAAVRQNVRMELRAPFALGKVLSVEPWLRGTAAAYEFQAVRAPLGNAWAVGGLTLSTLLTRTYGAGSGRLRHDVAPRIEWRAGTGVAGPGLPAYAYDELDVAPEVNQPRTPNSELPIRPLSALPGGSFDQLRVAVRNRLVRPGGPMAELEVGQDLDLKSGARSETFVNGSCTLGPVSAGATSRFRAFGASAPEGTPAVTAPRTASWLDRFTLLAANLTVSDGRGDNIHSNFLSVASGGSPQLKAGLDPLFDPRPVFPQTYGALPLLPVAQASVGLQVKLDGLTATYDANFVPRQDVGGPARLDSQSINLNWDSPCHCWRAGVGVTIHRDGSMSPGFLLDLSSGFSSASFQ